MSAAISMHSSEAALVLQNGEVVGIVLNMPSYERSKRVFPAIIEKLKLNEQVITLDSLDGKIIFHAGNHSLSFSLPENLKESLVDSVRKCFDPNRTFTLYTHEDDTKLVCKIISKSADQSGSKDDLCALRFAVYAEYATTA